MTLFRKFLYNTHAAGTAISAVMLTLMSLAGIALVGDHHHLTYQRDLLQVASDSAGVALMNTLDDFNCNTMTNAQINTVLQPIARRYILANLPEGKRAKANETLEIAITHDCTAGTAGVRAQADLGGVVFGRWLWDDLDTASAARSGFEQINRLTEVALAIDSTSSMAYDLQGRRSSDNKMAIVKRAALELVDLLNNGSDDSAAIGLVPWHYRVRFDSAMAQRWEDNGWAFYPTERYYPNPYPDSTTGETHMLPAPDEEWQGCPDQRTIPELPLPIGTTPPGLSTVLPTQAPFMMGFYSPTINYPKDHSVNFECHVDHKPRDVCYSNPNNIDKSRFRFETPQYDCTLPPIIPLTTDTNTIKAAIRGLGPGGAATYSTLGVVWGHRLLAPAWRSVWGDQIHPIDPSARRHVQKALILLTDGDDSHLLRKTVVAHRQRACSEAKAAGIKVFTIAAMDPSRIADDKNPDDNLGVHLERCSSQADDPEGTYVFINNTTNEELEEAFRKIGRQLKRFRRIY